MLRICSVIKILALSYGTLRHFTTNMLRSNKLLHRLHPSPKKATCHNRSHCGSYSQNQYGIVVFHFRLSICHENLHAELTRPVIIRQNKQFQHSANTSVEMLYNNGVSLSFKLVGISKTFIIIYCVWNWIFFSLLPQIDILTFRRTHVSAQA